MVELGQFTLFQVADATAGLSRNSPNWWSVVDAELKSILTPIAIGLSSGVFSAKEAVTVFQFY